MSSWSTNHLSKAGRLIMIKSVLQTILIHLMSCIRIPKQICVAIEKYIRKFYWGGNQSSNKIHWIKWKTLCKRKSNGDLGLRQIFTLNQILLAKHGWNFITSPNSLTARLFKSLYFPQCSFLEAKLGSKPFVYWRALLWGREIFNQGAGWRIGSGEHIDIRGDNWILGTTFFKPFHPQ